AQGPQLIAARGHELPAHAAFLDSIAFHNALHRSPIVSRGQPGHHTFPHGALQFSVLLQLTEALQLHFLAFVRPHSWSFYRDLLARKHHATGLLPPPHSSAPST